MPTTDSRQTFLLISICPTIMVDGNQILVTGADVEPHNELLSAFQRIQSADIRHTLEICCYD